jgi:hypothetical protein
MAKSVRLVEWMIEKDFLGAGATANHKLTFRLGHSAGADQTQSEPYECLPSAFSKNRMRRSAGCTLRLSTCDEKP